MRALRRFPIWLAALLLPLVAGCATPAEEKARAYNEDGVYLYRQGQYVDARDSFRAGLALAPNDPAITYNMAACCASLRDYANAEQYYAQVLQRTPEENEARYALVMMRFRQGKKAEAAQLVDQWIAGQPRLATAYAADGWLWHQAGDLPRAQARLQQALELDPHEPHALTEMGRVFEDMQRPDRAVALYEQALELNPRQPELTSRVNALLAKGAARPKPD